LISVPFQGQDNFENKVKTVEKERINREMGTVLNYCQV
jgi:hypothetical protein